MKKAKVQDVGPWDFTVADLEAATVKGDIDSLTKINNLIKAEKTNHMKWKKYCDNSNYSVKNTNLVILSCKYNNVGTLQYLFDKNSKILNYLHEVIRGIEISPSEKDDTGYNAFYYAIRSGNIELLDTLINKWPNNYFEIHLNELDEILSIAYEELKLKNVPLSEAVEIFIENKLINLRFFSDTSEEEVNSKVDLDNIKKRIDLVVTNISLLIDDYSNVKNVDAKFLFIAKFIAQSIHVLKRQLKLTYGRLPWEEIEFCLISFISSHTKQQEINLFYRAVLSKRRILNYLESFSRKLQIERDAIEFINVAKLSHLPPLKREKVIATIISNCPEFKELYGDYQQIRDICSLEKISTYTKLAASVDPGEREGQLIITRVLQVIGEYLKDTLESPKLSSTISDYLFLSFSKNIKNVIVGIRNSLSHCYFLSKRTAIEQKKNVNFFTGVQNDTKKIGEAAHEIVYKIKIQIIRIVLEKIIHNENDSEVQEIAKIFTDVKLDKIFPINFKLMEYEKIEKLIKQFSDSISNKTNTEEELFSKIAAMITSAKAKFESIQEEYAFMFASFKSVVMSLSDKDVNPNTIDVARFSAIKALRRIAPQIESCQLTEIAQLSTKIYQSVKRRMQDDSEVWEPLYGILCITEFDMNSVKLIEQLKEKLSKKYSSSSVCKDGSIYAITKKEYHEQLASRLSELKSILNSNELHSEATENFSAYKDNYYLQAVVEMLMLDIMSILDGSKNYLENNLLFLDDNIPILTGKCLRNHLAHDNTVLDILLSDPTIAIILNAKMLSEKDIIDKKCKIGKLVRDDPWKLKNKFDQGLTVMTIQEQMFAALWEGNLQKLQHCLKQGADINARDINSWNALHYAAKGPCLEVVKYVLHYNADLNINNNDNQSPLHIAATYGRKNIVEFFLTTTFVDAVDASGKTALHIACKNGHEDIVKILLKHNANTNIEDRYEFVPLHYAVKHNKIDIVKLLLERELHVDAHELSGGFTLLHIAAEYGHLDIVNFLLYNGANVNARTNHKVLPLHTASLNGYMEIAKSLIFYGADVNATTEHGFTVLYFAIDKGQEKIGNLLLKHGADANAFETTHNYTPLHCAAENGYEKVAEGLLKHKANPNVVAIDGTTPLHLAIEGVHPKIVMMLIKCGAKVNARTNNDATPLHYAADAGNKTIAEILLKKGASINSKMKENLTPLYKSAFKGHKDVVAILIKNGAAINIKNGDGNTPLHAAADGGYKDVIDILIKNNAQVNSKNNVGMTPLHLAALSGHSDICICLLKNNAEINAMENSKYTPLHAASMAGHVELTNILIDNGAEINATNILGMTPLSAAAEYGHREVVEVLLAKGATINIKCGHKLTMLNSAVRSGFAEIVEILLMHGADINENDGTLLLLAVFAGYRDIVEILLKYKADVSKTDPDNSTALHIAAMRGHGALASILITNGTDVDAVDNENATPLYCASRKGYEDIVEILVDSGANMNIRSKDGFTPVNIAAAFGHRDVVEILLKNGANVHIRDNNNQSPLESAVLYAYLDVIKALVESGQIDVNTRSKDDWTILHVASHGGNLDIVKYMIKIGLDINARNSFGSKPIHIAAKEGHKDVVQLFLSKGLAINDAGGLNKTLVHYAASNGRLNVVEFLVTEGANINAKDANGITPIHIAVHHSYQKIVELLLKNGAFYDVVDKHQRKPKEVASDKNIVKLLTLTEELLKAVEKNSPKEVERCIKIGAYIDAKNANNVNPLHYAASKGYEEIVKILLKNNADPNSTGDKGHTPLHYAVKSSHVENVITLLRYGAIYDAVTDGDETPLNLASDKNISDLLQFINEAFRNVEENNHKVISDLNKLKDINRVRAIMCARNKLNQTLVVAAMRNNFSRLGQLEEILQGDISIQINTASLFARQKDYQRAVSILKRVLEKRKGILGPNNPATVDIEMHIAKVLYAQGLYQEALNMFVKILEKQRDTLQLNDMTTLTTKSFIALIYHKQERNDDALKIYRDIYQQQTKTLGLNYKDSFETQLEMSLVLNSKGNYEEALRINKTIFEKSKKKWGSHDPITVRAENNIAMILSNQGKYKDALTIYKSAIEKKKIIFGMNHTDYLRTFRQIASVLFKQKNYIQAWNAYQNIHNIQEKILGPKHPDTMITQCDMINVLFSQGKFISALKIFKENYCRILTVLGPVHPCVLDMSSKIEMINNRFKLVGNSPSEILQHLQKDMNIAACHGDVRTICFLLNCGADVNDADIDGTTPLHYAINNNKLNVISILLKSGSDVTKITNKGNTPLHTAVSKGSKDIVELLLRHVTQQRLNDFINAKTITGGTTSLHVAANNGFLEIINSLLKCGAIYNIKNNEGKTPVDFSKDKKIANLLKLIEELFGNAKNGNSNIINRLKTVEPDEFEVLVNARNEHGKTLLQTAIVNNHKDIARNLLTMLKKPN